MQAFFLFGHIASFKAMLDRCGAREPFSAFGILFARAARHDACNAAL
ncbi:hypothetical protein RD1_2740 [Roseobacter denitrificans OCh 114]|uniref:Uncharacterized protein n=1 Tax=Roseobacter denitrificans (strain ATCC 33942 / OCh 114) TaxID=375451 RepID=Q165S0_ROSDO|nr:hypothetical protein RD1_2740 [Roseobacter denitrificans OCh 114]